MKSRTRVFAALALFAGVVACGDESAPLAPLDIATARAVSLANPGPPDHRLAGKLTGLAGLVQVQDARLLAVADGFTDPPEPGRPVLLAALGVIESAASSIAGRAIELERLMGAADPPDPNHPPDPGLPPDPCRSDRFLPPIDPDVPPDPCLAGLLGSIGNVLEEADSRLAGIQAGFHPPDPGHPALLAALANLKAAAMSLAATAAGLSNELGR